MIKNKTGSYTSKSIGLIVSILLLVTIFAFFAFAHDVDTPFCTATGSYNVCSNQDDYTPESIVHIAGNGFSADTQLTIKVTRPDGSVVSGDGSFAPWPTDYDKLTTDADGKFQYDYKLDGVVGQYHVDVLDSDGNVLATHTFLDASISVDFSQCSNNNPTAGSCHWIGSILQASNSVYFEGMSVPERIVYPEVKTSGTHTITFAYSYTKGGIHAYDFLTTVNQGNAGFSPGITNLNNCNNLNGADATACNALILTSPNSVTIPYDSFNSKDSAPAPGTGSSQNTKETNYETAFGGARQIKVYAGGGTTPFSAPTVTLIHNPSGANSDTGDTEVQVTLTFSSSGCINANPCQYLVYFGGHLAVSGTDSTTGSNWGPGIGSANINGGPYHIKSLAFDGNGGSLDNQIQGASIMLPPPTLKVIKIVSGGTATPNQFSIHVKNNNVDVAGSPQPGDTTGTTYTLSAGTFVVSEDSFSGYTGAITGDCASNGQVTLAAGDTKTCTITNTKDIPLTGTLTVIKHVTNNNGGTKGASDFNIHVKDGSNEVAGSPAAGAESPGTPYSSLNAGTYTVSEDSVNGYTQTGFSGDCDSNGAVTLAGGESKTCTITNDDIQPKLTVIKHVTNDNGGNAVVSDFTLKVDSTQVTSGVQNGFNAGTYTVSENTLIGYTPSSWSGDCNADGTITLNVGNEKTCEITNDDVAPKLTLKKVVQNDHGGNAGVDDFGLTIGGIPVDSEQTLTLSSNIPYAVDEAGLSGYDFVSISGDEKCPDALGGTVTLDEGDDVACTITNQDKPAKIKLTKEVVNDNGGNAGENDFGLTVGGNPVTSGSTTEVDSNNPIAINEAGLDGYNFVSITGEGCPTQLGGTAALNEGQEITCTIKNDDQPGHLIVHKVTDPVDTSTEFSITASGNGDIEGSATQTITGGSSVDYTVNAGTYSVSEEPKEGWDETGNDCSQVPVGIGETKECTITNTERGNIIIKKAIDSVNENDVTKVFTYSTDNVDYSGFILHANEQNSQNLKPDTYTVTESFNENNWRLIDVTCDDGGSGNVNDKTATINLEPGATVTCTFTNQKWAKIIVDKVTDPSQSTQEFNFNLNGGPDEQVGDVSFPITEEFSLTDQATPHQSQNLIPGTYSVAESPLAGWDLTNAVCTSALGNNEDPSAIELSAGEVVNCTFTNTQRPHLTVTKIVVNDNGGTKQVSDFPLTVDDNSVTSGITTESTIGTHTVAETNLPGYSSTFSDDCDEQGKVALAAGDDKTCTITNNDVQPTLKVVKVVTNDNGGNKQISDFPLKVGDTSVNSGDTNSFDAATYTVSETGQSGYSASFSGDCDSNGQVTLNVGDELKTCTITNDDIAPKLTVTKVVINNDGGTKQISDFPLKVNSTSVTSGIQNTFNAGAYAVSETGDSGYASSISGDCASDGSITLNLGDVKSCTITNDDIKPTTRTLGFWQTHTAFTTSIFGSKLSSSMLIGNGGSHKGPVDTINKIFGAYYSSIPYKTTAGAARSPVDKARMQLLQQLVTAKINCAAFGCSSSTTTLIGSADTAYAGANSALMLSLSSQLDAYNNLGDSQPIPASLGSVGSATPKTSQSIAIKQFWDTP